MTDLALASEILFAFVVLAAASFCAGFYLISTSGEPKSAHRPGTDILGRERVVTERDNRSREKKGELAIYLSMLLLLLIGAALITGSVSL